MNEIEGPLHRAVSARWTRTYVPQGLDARPARRLLPHSWKRESRIRLAGQVTARANSKNDTPGTFWTLQFGYGFEEATAKRMVLVDEDLKPLKGGRPESRRAIPHLDLQQAAGREKP